jgi:hypothetical protein
MEQIRISCYANEKDCRCYIEFQDVLDPELKRQVYEAIYGKFNQIAYVGWSDTKILIRSITDCSPGYHPENIELVVNMCETVLSKTLTQLVKFWGECPGDNDFGFTILW